MNIDIIIVAVFLIANLVVGLMHGKKVKTIKDYALGGRNFSTAALVATIVATLIGGGTFFTITSKTYSDGLFYLIPSLSAAIGYILTVIIFIPRMEEFLGDLSIAESMHKLYGKNVRIITSLTGIVSSVGMIAVQFKAFGSIFSYFLDFSSLWSVIIAGSIVTLYSSLGGIRAVTFTDIFQFFTFGFILPFIGLMIWLHINGSGISLLSTSINPKFDIKAVLNIKSVESWSMIPLILYFSIPALDTATYQRILIAKNIQQVKKTFLISILLLISIKLIVAWVPFLLFSISPNLDSTQLHAYIINQYTFTGLKGLIIVAIVAMAMSTADSFINSSSVLFAYDFCKPLGLLKFNELMISKIFAIFLGIGSITLAIYGGDLLSIILIANSFYMPIVIPPLLLAILGFRSTSKSVLIGMVAGFSMVILLKWIIQIKIDPIVIAMLTNTIFFMGSHYLLRQKGGWVGIKDRRYLDELAAEKKYRRTKLWLSIKNFSIIEFCLKNAPKNELTYMSVGIYCIIFTISTM